MLGWLRAKLCFHKWIDSPWPETRGGYMCERCGETYYHSGHYMGRHSSFPWPNP